MNDWFWLNVANARRHRPENIIKRGEQPNSGVSVIETRRSLRLSYKIAFAVMGKEQM